MTMPREVARRRPADLAPTQIINLPTAPDGVRRMETLIGSPGAISKEVARLRARGELVEAGGRRVIPAGKHAGLVRCDVTLRRVPAPSWTARAVSIGAGLGMLAGVAGAFLWLLTAMSGAALVGFCAMALIALTGLVRAGRTPSRTSGVTATAVAVASVTVQR